MKKCLGWVALMMLGGCYEVAPAPLCGAMDARGEGMCRLALGWSYDGDACVPLGGCACVGDDCDETFATESECATAYARCIAPVDECAAQDAISTQRCIRLIGYKFDGDSCVRLDCNCEGRDCDEIAPTQQACEQTYAQCIAPPPPPPPPPPPHPPACAAQDARGEGFCAAFFGYAYDGRNCAAVNGCSCVGGDCDALAPSQAACEAEHVECVSGPCDAVDPNSFGLCDAVIGVIFDGARCVTASGCGCRDRCDAVYDTVAACEVAHIECNSSCAPADARGEGACRQLLGYVWTDGNCRAISGCRCVGADCDRLYETHQACSLAYSWCDEA